jgi:bifunctional non-homologous end joining protein LigD
MTTSVGNPPIHDLVLTITPQLADTDSASIQALVGSHVFDEKLDGVRALAAWSEGILTMRNRSGRVMDNYLDLEVAAPTDLRGPVVLDGEIVSKSRKFQEIAARDKQRGAKAIAAMKETPAYFVAFDILWHPESGDVRHLPYSERRALLESLIGGWPTTAGSSGRWSITEQSADPKFYDEIRARGGEGVVAKRLSARYEPGRRKSWLKFKSTHRVTCIATGYEPGNGARAQFGAMFIAVIGPDGVVDVGRVGSGFNLPTSLTMKKTLDAVQSAEQLPIVEIECLGITLDGKLRQPVFIGPRTDLNFTDCVVTQLDSLPRG